MAFGFLSRDMGIDLGTANTLVFSASKGMVVREPSVVAVSGYNRKEVLAVGEDAKRMLGRTPGNIIAVKPLKEGVIADFEITEIMLRHFIKKAISQSFSFGFHPRVVICVPCGVTEVEKRAVEEAARGAGAKEAYLMEEPMAAAIGAGLPIQEAMGYMIVDIGGGTSEVAVLSLGGIVSSKSLRVGGNNMDDVIIAHVKKEYNMMIGERTAEDIKMVLGSAFTGIKEEVMNIRGRDLLTGLPNSVTISSEEVRDALREPCGAIVEAIKQTLEKTPPELAADIIEQGIVLSGGGALLRGLDKLISKETGIPVHIAESPLDCVVTGAGLAIQELGLMRKVSEDRLRMEPV